MDFQKIADKALHLTEDERELLAKRLIASLQSPTAEELRLDAILKAERRAKDLDGEVLQPVSEEDIMLEMRDLKR